MDTVADDVRTRMRQHLGGAPGEVGRERTTAARRAEIVFTQVTDPAVSVVTVTYGTGPVIVDCLAAVAANTSGISIEVIVVDQPVPSGGDRGLPVAERLALATSGVRVASTTANHGFGGGNAVGVARARGSLVVLLNPDAIVQPGWLEPLLGALDDPTVGIAAPLLRNPDGTIQEAGQTLDDQAITRPITDVPSDPITDVAFASAACWAMRRSDYEAVGGFDPLYHPAYFEDADLALRMRRAGLRSVVVAASEVVHHHGTSTRGRTIKALRQQAIFRQRWSLATPGT